MVGNQVRRSGVTIGTLTTASNGVNKLEIRFNAEARPTYVLQLLRTIRFRTVGSSNTNNRLLTFTLTDGSNGSVTATKTIEV